MGVFFRAVHERKRRAWRAHRGLLLARRDPARVSTSTHWSKRLAPLNSDRVIFAPDALVFVTYRHQALGGARTVHVHLRGGQCRGTAAQRAGAPPASGERDGTPDPYVLAVAAVERKRQALVRGSLGRRCFLSRPEQIAGALRRCAGGARACGALSRCHLRDRQPEKRALIEDQRVCTVLRRAD